MTIIELMRMMAQRAPWIDEVATRTELETAKLGHAASNFRENLWDSYVAGFREARDPDVLEAIEATLGTLRSAISKSDNRTAAVAAFRSGFPQVTSKEWAELQLVLSALFRLARGERSRLDLRELDQQ